MICCKADGCFIPHLINTQSTAFLVPMISHGADTGLHAWRNASLSTRRKLDNSSSSERGALPATSPRSLTHSFPASFELRKPIFKEINPCAAYLFSLSLPHLNASRKVWREFHYWCIFPHLSFPFLLCSSKSTPNQRVQQRLILLDAWIITGQVL